MLFTFIMKKKSCFQTSIVRIILIFCTLMNNSLLLLVDTYLDHLSEISVYLSKIKNYHNMV